MATWKSIADEAPAFAARVRERFEAGTNKTLATVRADGSPRISASECKFVDGELTLGMMAGSMKLLDVQRDPRVAIHSPTLEPPPQERVNEWAGDAKMAGVVVPIPPPAGTPFPDEDLLARHHRGGAHLRRRSGRSPGDRVMAPGLGYRRRTRK